MDEDKADKAKGAGPAPDRDKPRRLETVKEATGPSTAEKAGAQEQRVNIGNAGKRDHNL